MSLNIYTSWLVSRFTFSRVPGQSVQSILSLLRPSRLYTMNNVAGDQGLHCRLKHQEKHQLLQNIKKCYCINCSCGTSAPRFNKTILCAAKEQMFVPALESTMSINHFGFILSFNNYLCSMPVGISLFIKN